MTVRNGVTEDVVTAGDSATALPADVQAALDPGRRHISALVQALGVLDTRRLDNWGQRLAGLARGGGRLLIVGEDSSAAHSRHLWAELTGKFAADRPPYSAIVLRAGTPAVTAIASEYGHEEVFAWQVRAFGGPGDVLIALSASGRDRSLLRAVSAAGFGIATWALTGPAPNPLAQAADEAVCVQCDGAPADAATVREAHRVALHLICLAFDMTMDRDLTAREATS
jgi:phosphoheptose isomerase